MSTRQHPPSVDTLARSLASSGLPHTICVDIARAAIAADDVSGAAARAEAFRRTLLTPVVNATGVLLHTNLGRAPSATTRNHSRSTSSSTWRPVSAARANVPSANCSPACAAPSRR